MMCHATVLHDGPRCADSVTRLPGEIG